MVYFALMYCKKDTFLNIFKDISLNGLIRFRFIEYLKLECCLFYLLLPSRSKDEEIELVTLDDFYKTAPADISRPVSFSLLSKLLNFVSCALERLAFIFRIILLFLLCRIYLLISEQNYIF